MRFHFIDVLLIGGLALGVFLGFRGGFTKKIFNVLALIGSIVAATHLMVFVGDLYLDLVFSSPHVAYAFGFSTVIVILMTAAILLYRKFASAEMANSTSQGLGMILGAFEGAMVTSIVLIMLKVLGTPESTTRDSSLLYDSLSHFVPNTFDMMKSYLPGASDFREELSRTFKDADIFEQVSDADSAL